MAATEAAGADRRRDRHEQTRREIIDAAWQLAEASGIAGLSFRQVARQIGMQAPSLYTYFPSKDALLDAMFAEGYERLGALAAEWTASVDGQDPRDALAYVIAAWIRFCQESVARYQLMFTRAVPGWEPSPQAYAVSVEQYDVMAETLARFGIASPPDVDLYTALSSGLAAQQLANDPTGDRWIRLAPIAADMLLSSITRRNS